MQPALVLSVVAAWRDARYVSDLAARQVTLVDRQDRVLDRIGLTKVTRVFGDQKGCPIMTNRTRYGEMLAVRAPDEVWHDIGRRFDYHAVLASTPERLAWARGRIVLVGAADSSDQFEQHLGLRTMKRLGVERHADGIATILGHAETRPVGRFAEYLIVAVFAVLAAFLASRSAGIRFRTALLITAGIFVLLLAIATALYWGQHRLLNLMYPMLAFALTFLVLLRLRVKWLI